MHGRTHCSNCPNAGDARAMASGMNHQTNRGKSLIGDLPRSGIQNPGMLNQLRTFRRLNTTAPAVRMMAMMPSHGASSASLLAANASPPTTGGAGVGGGGGAGLPSAKGVPVNSDMRGEESSLLLKVS